MQEPAKQEDNMQCSQEQNFFQERERVAVLVLPMLMQTRRAPVAPACWLVMRVNGKREEEMGKMGLTSPSFCPPSL